MASTYPADYYDWATGPYGTAAASLEALRRRIGEIDYLRSIAETIGADPGALAGDAAGLYLAARHWQDQLASLDKRAAAYAAAMARPAAPPPPLTAAQRARAKSADELRAAARRAERGIPLNHPERSRSPR